MEFKSSGEYACGIGQDVFQGCSIPNPIASTLKPHPCPLCKSKRITIRKEYTTMGMHESCADWSFCCDRCGLVRTYIPADDYYGRAYCKTMDEAIKKWNDLCMPYDETEEERHFTYNIPDKCKDCISVGEYPGPLGSKFYCHMNSIQPNDVQQDISTCYVDPETRPEWCPMEKINKELEMMAPEKREQFNKIAEGLSLLFGAASAWKKEE